MCCTIVGSCSWNAQEPLDIYLLLLYVAAMGRKSSSGKGGESSKASQRSPPADASAPQRNSDGLILVDPSRIRFQYSRIRPYFSGCGRSVISTLDSIRNGELSPNDLPPIQVIIGPVDEGGEKLWYFSLNNRRLWVLKRCAEEGLLEHQSGKIWVRVREPKSPKERERYTLEHCAVEAKFIRERDPFAQKEREGKNTKDSTKELSSDEQFKHYGKSAGSATKAFIYGEEDKDMEDKLGGEYESSSEESSEDVGGSFVNRFAGLDF